jgi:hypothetical protein
MSIIEEPILQNMRQRRTNGNDDDVEEEDEDEIDDFFSANLSQVLE